MELDMDMPDDATQYLTVYDHKSRAVATLQRRRVYESGPAWTIWDTDGRQIGRIWQTRSYPWLHERVISIVRTDLAGNLEG
jgi:hypothetical protein